MTLSLTFRARERLLYACLSLVLLIACDDAGVETQQAHTRARSSEAAAEAASAPVVPDSFVDAVVICDVAGKGRTYRVLLPTGEAFFVDSFYDQHWKARRARLDTQARRKLEAVLPGLFALPPRLFDEGVIDGTFHDFRVVTPTTRHAVSHHGVESETVDRFRDTCDEVFGTLSPPAVNGATEALEVLRGARDWALTLPNDDLRRATLVAWLPVCTPKGPGDFQGHGTRGWSGDREVSMPSLTPAVTPGGALRAPTPPPLTSA